MSKKSRKNPSKLTPPKVISRAPKSTAKKTTKTSARSAAKTAAKSPAKKPAAKPTTKPAAKVKAPVKTAAKAAVTKKAVTAKKPPAAARSSTAKPASAEKANQSITTIATEGQKAPDFALPRDGGATVSLADYAGQKLVLFFYPRASTPGCTKEAIDFTRLSGDFQAAGTAVLGVSADPLKAQESFRDKYGLEVPLLSDSTQSMLKSYGAWGEKSMYGKVFEGVLRTTVLIGKDGKVAKIWRSVKVDGHADAVLKEAQQI